jgi:L-ascorbate metabolism protein UlaG (beta-lactamase superfamily)
MNIELIAQNAIRIKNENGRIIYFDPFKIDEKYENDADVIFITHSHYDHFSPEDIDLIRKKDTKIVVTSDLLDKVKDYGFDEDDILVVIPNNEYEICGIRFKTIPAYNTNKQFHKKEYNWVGYIVEIDDEIVYIAGDTDITDEALNVKCDIACIPIGGTYTMTAEEAAELIRNILPKKYAIPTHYKTLVGSDADARRFRNLLQDVVDVKILM